MRPDVLALSHSEMHRSSGWSSGIDPVHLHEASWGPGPWRVTQTHPVLGEEVRLHLPSQGLSGEVAVPSLSSLTLSKLCPEEPLACPHLSSWLPVHGVCLPWDDFWKGMGLFCLALPCPPVLIPSSFSILTAHDK